MKPEARNFSVQPLFMACFACFHNSVTCNTATSLPNQPSQAQCSNIGPDKSAAVRGVHCHESGAYRNTEPKPCEGFSLNGPVMARTGCLGFHASESTLRGGFVSGTSQGFRPASMPQCSPSPGTRAVAMQQRGLPLKAVALQA